MDEEKFTEIAKANFYMRCVCGIFAGILGLIVGIFLIVFAAIKNIPELIVGGIFVILAALAAGISCGYCLHRKKEKPQDKKAE